MIKLILSSIFAFAMSVLAVSAEAQVIVIANASVKASGVSKDDLKDVFTGNATALKDGSRVVPVLLKDGSARATPLTGRDGAAWSSRARPACLRAWTTPLPQWHLSRIPRVPSATSIRQPRTRASRYLKSTDAFTAALNDGSTGRLRSLNVR
jgi:hypothetical protein